MIFTLAAIIIVLAFIGIVLGSIVGLYMGYKMYTQGFDTIAEDLNKRFPK